MKKPEIGIVMGSDSDWDKIKDTAQALDGFGVGYEVSVISAHRTPDRAVRYARSAAGRGLKTIIAAAGGAAHLAGVISANTRLPVIGLPVAGGSLGGIDALLSTVQMPGGVPVASVTLGNGGPVNAAVFAVRILAVSRPELARRLERYAEDMKAKVLAADRKIRRATRKR